MTAVSQDVRFSLRMLQKHKGFTIVSALTLALGIGVNTAMFSVLNTFLFGALPYPQSERLIRVFRTSPHSQSWPPTTSALVISPNRGKQRNVYSVCRPPLISFP